MQRRIRLAHKLIVLVIATAAVTVVLPSVLVISRVSRALEAKVAALMRKEARLGVAEVGRTLRSDVRAMLDLADELEEFEPDADRREQVVLRCFDQNAEMMSLGLEPFGQGDAPWRRRRGGPAESDAPQTGLPAEQFVAYNRAEVGVAHRQGAEDLLIIAVRVGGRAPGRLVSQWRLSAYSDVLRRLSHERAGHVFLVDREGRLLAHPESRPDAASGRAPPYARPGTYLGDLPVVRDAFTAAGTAALRYESEEGLDIVAGGMVIPELGWAVVATQPAHAALGAVEEIKEEVMLVGTTAGLVAILLGLAIVGTITRPLEELAEAANRVGSGDLTHPVGMGSNDEVGQLALAFNEMQIRLRQVRDKQESLISERTHELVQTTDFLNSVLDSSTEYSIIATDLHGTILSYNEGARRIYGYEPEEIIGAPVTILIPRDHEQRAETRAILEKVRRDGIYSGETVRVRKGGKTFPARFVMTVRYDDAGNPMGYTTISRDVTQQKEMEARLMEYTENLEALVASKTRELQEANVMLERANRLKAEFLASMSHELRTPLNAIIGFAGVLREGVAGDLTDDQRQCVEDIHKSGQQLLNLINDILDLSKIDSGRMELQSEMVELEGIFDEVQTIIQGMAVRKGLSLSFRQEPPGIVIEADRVKVLQILYNLLSNAVKFTPDGGSIRVEAQREPSETVFRVIDTGVGIPAESLELVFEEFRQVDSRLSREYGGTGLGLALTRKLVELHGGRLSVESEVGTGSTFMFTIPHELPGSGEEESGLFTSPTAP